MLARECPMCGETMHLNNREVTERIPGSNETRTQTFSEWTCPECDYFEEADGESEE
jgi:transposase